MCASRGVRPPLARLQGAQAVTMLRHVVRPPWLRGVTWSKVEDAPELLDPGCMGSVLRYTDPAGGGKSRILYAGPQSTRRENGTVFVSYDEGKTWPTKRVLCEKSFAYSCLTALPDGTIGCLYEAEGAGKIVFARFTLDWLTRGEDKGTPGPAPRPDPPR